MQKINNRPYDQSDRLIANMLGVTPEEYLKVFSLIDEDQRDAIMSRLLSDSDREINEGIMMFKDLDV